MQLQALKILAVTPAIVLLSAWSSGAYAGEAAAPPSTIAPPAAASSAALGQAEFLVPPGGGAYEVPVKLGEVCILTFPGQVTHSAVRSAPTFEVKPWNQDSLAVRALPGATSATLAVSTQSGAIKVNVTLRVAGPGEPTLALVKFRAVTAEEAYEARVAAEVAKRMTPLVASLDAERARLESELLALRDRKLIERARARSGIAKPRAYAQSADKALTVRVDRVLSLGDEAYLSFTLDNRSKKPVAIARAWVSAEGAAEAPQTATLQSATKRAASPAITNAATEGASAASTAGPSAPSAPSRPSAPPGPLGVVPAQGAVAGLVVLRDAAKLRGKALTLTLTEQEEGGQARRVMVHRGVTLQ